MIKKLLLILGFFGFGLSSFVNGYTLIENCYTGASSCQTFDVSFPCWEIGNNEEFVYGNYTYKVDYNANFSSSYQGGPYYNSLIYSFSNNSYNYYNYLYWDSDDKLHKTFTNNINGSSVNFLSGGVCIVNSNDIIEIASMCGFWVQNSGPENCILGIPGNYLNDINLFYNTDGGFDKIYFLPGISNNGGIYNKFGRFCFIKGDTGYCLYSQYDDNFSKFSEIGTTVLNSSDFSNTNFNVENSSDSFYLSPFHGVSGGGETEGSNNDILITSGCSKQKALNYYENNGYTKKLCYGGYDDFTIWDGNPVGVLPYYGSGLDIEEIWLETANYYQGGLTGTAQSYSAWFGYRRQLYSTYKRGGYSSNPFVNTPLVMFGLFGAVDTYGVDYNSNSILDYCDLKLFTSDYNVAYTGVNKSNVCSLIDLVVDQITDGSGNVIIGIDTNDIVGGSGTNCLGSGCDQNLSGNNKIYENGSNFILDFSNELKSNFGNILNNDYGLGILPIYITIALCGLLLFRFMAH